MQLKHTEWAYYNSGTDLDLKCQNTEGVEEEEEEDEEEGKKEE